MKEGVLKTSEYYQEGIDPSRLSSKGYGEYDLVNDCEDGVECSEQQHQENRRSTFIRIKK
jgi:outer membrane protein OmpA-like peptidoglycan-associated protein